MPLPAIRDLPYCADSEKLMRALAGFEMPAFLDSGNHRGADAKKDILAAAPIAYLSIENGRLACSENATGLVTDSLESDEILNSIRALRDAFLTLPEGASGDDPDSRYRGAILAYLGYPSLQGRSKFILGDAFVGVYLWTVVVDHALETCRLCFHHSCEPAYIERVTETIDQALAQPLPTTEFHLTSAFESLSSYDSYSAAFSAIAEHIDRGDCYQVNLTQRFKAHSTGDPLAAYLRLRRATQAPFSAYFNWGAGALLSLSPERFIRLLGNEVLTQPVKGTRPRGATPRQDSELARELAASEKDKAENLMIVDLLRNDLGRVCETGSIEANQLFALESYSNVHHMVSSITGILENGYDALDLLAGCYPGGSITGAPKLSAMQIIAQLEQEARRAYCGTAFYLGPEGSFDSSITIRSLLWCADELSCWAGGGIVADSDCGQEYQECFDKVGNIFRALQD